MSTIVSPSLLAADFGQLKSQIELVNASNADWLHIDVMDGVFVPNISFGTPIMEVAQRYSQKPLDVHLMIVEPQKFIKTFATLGAAIYNVHVEVCNNLHRTIQEIKEAGMQAAVTLNPHSPVCLLENIISEVDMVLLMSVNPGFGGQRFIENTVDKTAELRKLITRKGSKALIEIDGGVNQETGKRLVAAGADVLVAGSYLFGASDMADKIDRLRAL